MNRGFARLWPNRLVLVRSCNRFSTTPPAEPNQVEEASAGPGQAAAVDGQKDEKTKNRSSLYSNFHKAKSLASTEQPMSFAKMLRHSKFVGLGNQKRVRLYGKIVETVGNDLYIDYGGKFNCVV